MAINIETIIFYVLLLDSLIACTLSWCATKWYKKKLKKYKTFARIFPLSKGWSVLYLLLVLWVGFALYRLGVLF